MNPNRSLDFNFRQKRTRCPKSVLPGLGTAAARLMADSALIEKGGAPGLGRGASPLFL